MSEEGKKRGTGFLATMAVISALVIYPLSVGPAMKFLYHVPVSERVGTAILAFYYPLYSIIEESESATNAAQWYVSLWGDFQSDSANRALLGR